MQLQTSGNFDLERTQGMGLILLVLLLVLIFAGAGFALHVLWIIAVVLLLIWLLGFLVSGAEHSWYRARGVRKQSACRTPRTVVTG